MVSLVELEFALVAWVDWTLLKMIDDDVDDASKTWLYFAVQRGHNYFIFQDFSFRIRTIFSGSWVLVSNSRET